MTPEEIAKSLQYTETLQLYVYILGGQVASLISLAIYLYTQLKKVEKQRLDDKEEEITNLKQENAILKEREKR